MRGRPGRCCPPLPPLPAVLPACLPPAGPAPARPPGPHAPQPPPPAARGGQRGPPPPGPPPGVSLTGAGFITMLIGGVLVGRALVDKRDALPSCDASFHCSLAGYTLGSEARDFALTATITLPIGLGVAAAGVGL